MPESDAPVPPGGGPSPPPLPPPSSADPVRATPIVGAPVDPENEPPTSSSATPAPAQDKPQSPSHSSLLPELEGMAIEGLPWFRAARGDLRRCYGFLSRAAGVNDTGILQDPALLSRFTGLQGRIARVKTALGAHDEGHAPGAPWPVAEIVEDLAGYLTAPASVAATTSAVLRRAHVELVELATELLVSHASVAEAPVLERWAALLVEVFALDQGDDVAGHERDENASDVGAGAGEATPTTALEAAVIDKDETDKDDDSAKLQHKQEETPGNKAQKKKEKKKKKSQKSKADDPPFTRPRRDTGPRAAHRLVQEVLGFLRSAPMTHSPPPRPPPAALGAWADEVAAIYARDHVPGGDERRRLDKVRDLERLFRRNGLWRRCELTLFGSSLSKFGSVRSDLDICLRAAPTHDGEDLAGALAHVKTQSIRELHARDRRQADAVVAAALTTSTDEDPPEPLDLETITELLDRTRKATQVAFDTLTKQSKRTKNRDADKLTRSRFFCLQWLVLQRALERAKAETSKGSQEVLTGSSSSPNGSHNTNPKTRTPHDEAARLLKQRQKELFVAVAMLKRNDYNVTLVVPSARVPVIRFVDPKTTWECDLCFENYLACINTRLLRAYAEFDDRARALGIAIKSWAKRRAISDASMGYLSSYSYILLVIYYLQVRAGLLPNLQDPRLLAQSRVPTTRYQGFDVTFCPTNAIARAFHTAHPLRMMAPSAQDDANALPMAGLGELLYGFFAFYAREFDFRTRVVSIRSPATSMGKSARWSPTGKFKSWRLSIEDPLERDRDLGCVLQFKGQRRILEEFARAFELLAQGESFETRVCASPEEKDMDDGPTPIKLTKQPLRPEPKAQAKNGKRTAPGKNATWKPKDGVDAHGTHATEEEEAKSTVATKRLTEDAAPQHRSKEATKPPHDREHPRRSGKGPAKHDGDNRKPKHETDQDKAPTRGPSTSISNGESANKPDHVEDTTAQKDLAPVDAGTVKRAPKPRAERAHDAETQQKKKKNEKTKTKTTKATSSQDKARHQPPTASIPSASGPDATADAITGPPPAPQQIDKTRAPAAAAGATAAGASTTTKAKPGHRVWRRRAGANVVTPAAN